MSGIPLEYWTGLGAVTAESLAAQGMEAQRKADALRNVPGQAAQADAFQRQADSLFAQARTTLPQDRRGPSAEFVPLSSHMYRTYPQLRGARIRSGHKLFKGPGEFFYIKNSAGRTVAKGLRATSNGPLFRGATRRAARPDPVRPLLSPPVIQAPLTIPQRGAFGFDSTLAPLTDLFRPQGQSQGYQPSLTIRSIPTWAWVAGGTITLLLAGGALKKKFGG